MFFFINANVGCQAQDEKTAGDMTSAVRSCRPIRRLPNKPENTQTLVFLKIFTLEGVLPKLYCQWREKLFTCLQNIRTQRRSLIWEEMCTGALNTSNNGILTGSRHRPSAQGSNWVWHLTACRRSVPAAAAAWLVGGGTDVISARAGNFCGEVPIRPGSARHHRVAASAGTERHRRGPLRIRHRSLTSHPVDYI